MRGCTTLTLALALTLNYVTVTACSQASPELPPIPYISYTPYTPTYSYSPFNIRVYNPWVYTTLPVTYMMLLENSEERVEEISHIVVHFISNVRGNPENPYIISEVVQLLLKYGASAHYIIGRDGTIYLSVPENFVAFHAGRGSLPDFPHVENRLNHYSIGIELLGIGTFEEMSVLFVSEEEYSQLDPVHIGFTEAQYTALYNLINDILARNPAIKPNRRHIVGHDEYAPNRRTDPGELFDWNRLGFLAPTD